MRRVRTQVLGDRCLPRLQGTVDNPRKPEQSEKWVESVWVTGLQSPVEHIVDLDWQPSPKRRLICGRPRNFLEENPLSSEGPSKMTTIQKERPGGEKFGPGAELHTPRRRGTGQRNSRGEFRSRD